MTITNPALHFSFAAAEAARLAQAERGAEDVVASQLRKAAQESQFTVGSTITARYQYKVAEDGSLVPTKTQITTEAPKGEGRGLGANRRQQRQAEREGQRPPSFRDFTPPKPLLAPADEAEIYTVLAAVNSKVGGVAKAVAEDAQPKRTTFSTAAEVVDESGEPVAAEILFPLASAPDNAAQSVRARFSVAALYASTSDIVRDRGPVFSVAA